MLQRLPVEIFLQVTDSLGPSDIYSLSKLEEFSDVFHIITDLNTNDLKYFQSSHDSIPRDLLMGDFARDSCRIYLIELTDLETFTQDDLIRFKGLRKVISVSADITSISLEQARKYEQLAVRLMHLFKDSCTKFSFIGFPIISINEMKIDPKSLEIKEAASLSISHCLTLDNTKQIQSESSYQVCMLNCEDDAIKNVDLTKNGTRSLFIKFADKRRGVPTKPLDLNAVSEKINLLNVKKISNCELKNATILNLTFHDRGDQDELYGIQTLSAENLQSLKIVVPRDLPVISNINLPHLHELYVDDTDDYLRVPQVPKEAVFFSNDLLHNLKSLSLYISGPRLLKNLRNYTLSVTDFKITIIDILDAHHFEALTFENLETLEIRIGGVCNIIPKIYNNTLKTLKITNDNINEEDVMFPADHIKDLYPNLESLVTDGFSDTSIISWIEGAPLSGIENLRLLNLSLNSPISLQNVEFPDLKFIEVNGALLERLPDVIIDINAPKLETLAVKVEDVEFVNESMSLWGESEDSLHLKVGNYKELKNLIVSSFTSIEIRNLLSLKAIYHGGKLQLQRLDADFLPLLEILVYKNLNRGRPIQSVQYINPKLQKKVIQTSVHPRSSVFTY